MGLYEKMMLATRLRSIRRVWAREGPLFDARTDEESMEAHEQTEAAQALENREVRERETHRPGRRDVTVAYQYRKIHSNQTQRRRGGEDSRDIGCDAYMPRSLPLIDWLKM
ncbi:hypothetical protein ACIHQR_22695 [Corallococcus coralloides]|uniref:hypothetical protein n=1 Tax=Corallococcus coralloides TaxID=184914 RepID=UPI00384B4C5E